MIPVNRYAKGTEASYYFALLTVADPYYVHLADERFTHTTMQLSCYLASCHSLTCNSVEKLS